MSAVGFGTARVELPKIDLSPHGSTKKPSSMELMEAAYELGCTHFDTADGYMLGASESLIGDFLSSAEDRKKTSTITTKVGWNFYNAFVSRKAKRYAKRRLGIDIDELAQGDTLPFDHGQNFSFPYLEFAVDRSLERMRRDTVDVLLLHVPSVETLKYSDWDKSLKKLRSRGKCEFYGVSVRQPLEAFAALQHGEPDILQVPVSITMSNPLRAALSLAKSRGVGVVGRELFYQGLLLKHRLSHDNSFTATARAWSPETVAQTILNEVLSNELIDSVIVGCSNLEQVQANFADLDSVHAASEKRDQIRKAEETLFENAPTAVPFVNDQSFFLDIDRAGEADQARDAGTSGADS